MNDNTNTLIWDLQTFAEPATPEPEGNEPGANEPAGSEPATNTPAGQGTQGESRITIITELPL